jgi:probable addiction module antidote protein
LHQILIFRVWCNLPDKFILKKHRIFVAYKLQFWKNFGKAVMTKHKIQQITGNYEEWLIHSLENKKEAATYLQVALDEYQKDGDLEAFLLALRHVAEAQGGLGKLAKKTHLNRESLYKTLSKKGNPKLQTIGILLKGLGFEFSIKAA